MISNNAIHIIKFKNDALYVKLIFINPHQLHFLIILITSGIVNEFCIRVFFDTLKMKKKVNIFVNTIFYS